MRCLVLTALMVIAPVSVQKADAQQSEEWQPSSVKAEQQEKQAVPEWASRLCLGDGCDAYLPILNKPQNRFVDYKARHKWGGTLGGVSGALIGEEIAGVPGALVFGAFGAITGYDYIDRERWEADAKAYDEAWQRGDDTYYNPANRFPLEAHWMRAGPAVPLPGKKNK